MTKEKGMNVWLQRWTETERGWGQRPDGYTVHTTSGDLAEFICIYKTEHFTPKDPAPDAYSFPDGVPVRVLVTDKRLIERLEDSQIGCWGKQHELPNKGHQKDSPKDEDPLLKFEGTTLRGKLPRR